MEKINKPIIVPWDFTQVAENAFMHALNFAQTLDARIALLHITADEKVIPEKQKKLEETAERLSKEYGKRPHCIVKEGSIFKTIGEVSTKYDAELIIMGTHGIKGAQKLFGSRAVKVVVSSRIPFLIVQTKPEKDKLKKILLPIDFKRENKEKANWIYHLSTRFESKVTIFKSHPKDKGFKRKLLSNMRYIENYLKTRDIDYEITSCEGKKKFKDEALIYAKENDFDLILIMATRDITWVDYFFGVPEQDIIANKQNLPVMCINPRPRKVAGGFSATGG
ncbi:MAG TPA: universal stress protein [Bacteroidales bacterium]|nr:universal stress protein [Bacteroidales bacterium]